MSAGVALVATLLNEEKGLAGFLDSVLSQTLTPQEIILVDGGSRDSSCEIIQKYIENGAPFRLLVKEGANRSQGRNIAIRESTQPIIAVCDAGCRLEKDWLERIVAPLEQGQAEVASGYYAAEVNSLMERAVAAATVPAAWEVNAETFLPSSRSVAFLKTTWEKAGGYPEDTIFSEDTLFDLAMKKAGARFSFVPEAVVHWKQQGNFAALFRQFYRYACSDGGAGLFFGHYRKTFFLAGWITALLLLAGLGTNLQAGFAVFSLGLIAITALVYAGRYILRARKRGGDWAAALLSPAVMAVVDTAHFIGYLSGLLRGKKECG